MALPKLLFENEKTDAVTDAFVIEDLKLDQIFEPQVSDYLILKPEKGTLLLRREMFSLMLKDESSLERIEDITERLLHACTLYRALTGAISESKAAYIFVHLMLALDGFCRSVLDAPNYGQLFSRFANVFAELVCKSEYTFAVAKAKSLVEALDAVASFTMKTDGENAVIFAGKEEGMAYALRACAVELGIELTEHSIAPSGIQKGIADAFSVIYPDTFADAKEFLHSYRILVTGEMLDYLPELQFILGILRFVKRAKENGIPYCFPELWQEKLIDMQEVYDVTLLKKEGTVIVPNDIAFTKDEPFFYLTGANGGGKTTYLRTVGVAVLLFLAGAPVFCKSGRCALLDNVLTHFPRDERFEGTGRFLDEKNRVDALMAKQSGNSLILLNETYSTTGEEKAIIETDILAKALYGSENFGLYITHQHDVRENTVPFLGVTVDENDSNRRTYKIEKRRLPPKSFAKDILEKYRLDKESLIKRFSL